MARLRRFRQGRASESGTPEAVQQVDVLLLPSEGFRSDRRNRSGDQATYLGARARPPRAHACLIDHRAPALGEPAFVQVHQCDFDNSLYDDICNYGN